jgi:phosphopentomutase
MHNATAQELGTRETFADVAATVADYFKVKENWATGTSFLPELEIAKAAVPRASK